MTWLRYLITPVNRDDLSNDLAMGKLSKLSLPWVRSKLTVNVSFSAFIFRPVMWLLASWPCMLSKNNAHLSSQSGSSIHPGNGISLLNHIRFKFYLYIKYIIYLFITWNHGINYQIWIMNWAFMQQHLQAVFDLRQHYPVKNSRTTQLSTKCTQCTMWKCTNGSIWIERHHMIVLGQLPVVNGGRLRLHRATVCGQSGLCWENARLCLCGRAKRLKNISEYYAM